MVSKLDNIKLDKLADKIHQEKRVHKYDAIAFLNINPHYFLERSTNLGYFLHRHSNVVLKGDFFEWIPTIDEEAKTNVAKIEAPVPATPEQAATAATAGGP